VSDEELLEKILRSAQGTKLAALWRGQWEGAYASQSEADLALASMLAFWTQKDVSRIDALVRRSSLMRDKWDARRGESTYGEQTIARALEGVSEVYREPRWPLTRASESVETLGDFAGDKGATDSLTSPIREVSESSQSPRVSVNGTDFSESVETLAPFALPLDEFLEARAEAPAALVGDESENMLPSFGLMMLFAKGGKGKTTLVVDAALHFASGVDWLGFPVPRPLRVLFIENEGPREPFRSKLELKRKLWKHEITGAIFVQTLEWGAFTLAEEIYVESLRGFVAEQEIDLVIGDPLDSLGIDGVGSPEDTRNFMELMSRVGLFSSLAFLLLHHPRKEGAQDELDEVQGAWGGKPDTMLPLERKEGNRARLSFPKVRWTRRGTRPAYILAFDPDTESFSVAHEEEDEERDHLVEIEQLLADHTWRTPKKIAAPCDDGGIGANVDKIKKLLEQHPDRFLSCNGAEIGRSPRGTFWNLAQEEAS